MKKLIALVALVAATCVANAASFKWTASNIYGSDGNKWTGLVTLYASGAGLETATAVATFTPVTAGTINTTFENDAFVAGSSYNFYFVVDDNGKSFTSTTKAVSAQATSTPTVGFGSMATATQDASNWKGGSSDVPEPTSGMLLLLGLAGLALRRKQA